MDSNPNTLITPDQENIKKRFYMLVELYNLFLQGVDVSIGESIYINKELLHCAVVAYFDDIEKYKAYAGSRYANKYKQAAFSIKWISRFRPIQIRETASATHQMITINASFALFCGFSFMSPAVADSLSPEFYNQLIYNLTYRNILGKEWAMIMELLDRNTNS